MSDRDMEEHESSDVEMELMEELGDANHSTNFDGDRSHRTMADTPEPINGHGQEGVPVNTSSNSLNRSAEEEFYSQLQADTQNSAPQSLPAFDFGIELPDFRPYIPLEQRAAQVHLFIRAITTENFKSYGGKKFLGPFDEKFTAIIGPNGCGKSNTIDALLFVFGFRSSKLRTRNLRELIHSSEGRDDCTSTKVTVHFTLRKIVEENSEANNDG